MNRFLTRRRCVGSLLAIATLVVLLLLTFARVLFQDHQFAFQDAGHFYYPLLLRVQQEWSAGRWPLWAPEESAGTPLLANPTAAVLYPGKVVFFLLPYPWAARVYVIAHVALAFGAMVAFLRGMKASAVGAILGGAAYAFGVPVLSQTSNVIFLVGASWLPLGFLAVERWVCRGDRRALPALAVVLAVQVLGGDPEAAYLTLIAGAGYTAGKALARTTRPRRTRFVRIGVGLLAVYVALMGLSAWSARAIHLAARGDAQPWHPPRGPITLAAWAVVAWLVVRRARGSAACRWFAITTGGLIASAGVALALTGAQLLPTLEYAAMSFRAAENEGFHDIFPYSAHPLQTLDAFWPGLFGNLEGGYRSWLNALPPKVDSRLWMPSLYLGGLTLVLAAVGFRSPPGNRPAWRVWLGLVLFLSVLAAWGYYASPVFLTRCLPGGESMLGPLEPPFSWQTRSDAHLRDGDGSLYWLLASAFPGFRAFRYPPKLFIAAAFAACALAGAGWDQLTAGRSRLAARLALGWLLVSAVALVASWLAATPLHQAFDRLATILRETDEPLDPLRAMTDLRLALAHGLIAAAVAFVLVRAAPRRPSLAGLAAILALTLDLGLTNSARVVTVPQSAFGGDPRALQIIHDLEHDDPSPGPFRVQRVGRWWPVAWSDATGGRDFATITRWERDTLRPLYDLTTDLESVFYFDTIEPYDYGLFFLPWALEPDAATAATHALKPGQKVWYYPRRGFDLWNTRYFIVPAKLIWDSPARGYAAFIPRSRFVYPPPDAFDGPNGLDRRAKWTTTEDFRILRNEQAYPRAWIVHRGSVSAPLDRVHASERTRVMRDLLLQNDEFWKRPGTMPRDPRTMAWIETDHPADLEPFLSRALPDPSEQPHVTRHEPQLVEIDVTLKTPGLLVLADRHHPGWRVTIDGQPGEILRANRAMRGVPLKAGSHHLIFEYKPLSFRIGLGISAVGFVALAVLAGWSVRGARREGDS